MRIPFPERVNLSYALIFATAVSSIQILEGTNVFFSGCVFCFLLIAAVAFNIAGGFPYPSGAFIGFNALLTVVLPMTAKIVLREPADSNLRAPMRLIEVYLLGMVGMLAAAIFSRRFRARKAHISGMLPEAKLPTAYIGCAVLSILLTAYLFVFNTGGNGTLSSFLVQANRFPMLTFVLGVIYTVHRTAGRRSVSAPLLAMMLISAMGALISFSKEQFISPFFAWGVTAALVRYRLHWINIISFSVGLYFVVTFLVPYAQYGRSFVTAMPPPQIAAYLLTHMDEVQAGYVENSLILGNVHYYDRSLGLLDRLDPVSGDSALIQVTDRDGTFGFEPIIEGFENIIPHVFFPNKPVPNFGNVYGHEIGVLPYDDFSTGISFSPSADAYREGGIIGVLVVEPLVFMLIFIVLDSVIGDVRLNPVGLLTTILVSRGSVEGALWGNAILIGQAMFTNVLAVYVCAYVLPVLGSIFTRQLIQPTQIALQGSAIAPSSHPVSTL